MPDTNAGMKVWVCSTPQPVKLIQSDFEALSWIEVAHVGSVGPSGANTNIVKYDELTTEVTQKQKGITDAQDTPIECARLLSDPGQQALRAASLTKYNYAMKFEDADKPSDDYTNTVTYRRGVITGPTRAGGKNEDFILDVFTLGNNQREVIVPPASSVAPTNTTRPAISGAATTQGTVLTAVNGLWTGEPTFTYQWQRDAAGNGTFANISGATAKTYTLAAGDASNCVRVQVTGTNGAGNATASSLPTKAVT